MKKFFTVLIILIALGAGGFFAGWAQLPVPHGSYGVLSSKTHGIYEQVIEDGKLLWLWYRLIPGNTTIAVFDTKTQNISVTVAGALPQGETYASFVGVKISLLWRISGNVSFSVKPAMLPLLVKESGLSNQAALDAYTAELGSRLAAFIEQRLSYYCVRRDVVEQLSAAGTYKNLDDDIRAAFPGINEISYSLTVKQFPDYDLYESAKSLYEDYTAHQREILNGEIRSKAAGRINSQFRLDELAKYGELLTKYPVLLDYLKLFGDLSVPPPFAPR
ncbi:MAG: hypothetical protein LBD86_04030 [Spirochaetaceae bacterium]|jgi:hypothetical protein|nr:hypothetical protein [Spirochaetaceae bacterium]